MEDKRLARIATDPKFRRLPKKREHVKINKKFQSMFKDKKFAVKGSVDIRGRPLKQTSSEELKRYYELSSEEEGKGSSESSGEEETEEDVEGTSDEIEEGTDDENEEGTVEKTIEEVEEKSIDESIGKTIAKNEKTEGKVEKDKTVVQDKKTQKSKTKKSKGKSKKPGGNAKELSAKTSFTKQEGDEKENGDIEKSDLHIPHKRDKKLPKIVKQKLRNMEINYARGEGALFSESSSDDDEEESEDEDEGIEHKWGELDNDAESTEEATYRLAVCNMDWDRLRAVDLLVLFNSFLPPGGVTKSVAIYPSQFGKERMKEEDIKGPIELVRNEDEDGAEKDEEDEEGAKYHNEKLRQYQLNRLKYYYAVVTFDSASSAGKIYAECDGMEYESSATKMDLRFIPDDMAFDEDEPKEVCDKLPEKYQPRFFTTTALQQAKVDLTWDETDPSRLEMLQKVNSGKVKVEEIPDSEWQNFVAASSSEGEASDDDNHQSNDAEAEGEEKKDVDPVSKYRALLQEIEQKAEAKENDFDMEITWGTSMQSRVEEKKKKKQDAEAKTPFQQMMDKKKEKRKEKRRQLKEQKPSDNDSDIPSDIDMDDPYFAEEFDKPEFKKAKNASKKPSKEEEEEEAQRKAELALLIDGDAATNGDGVADDSKGKLSKKKMKKNKKKQLEDEEDDDTVEDAKVNKKDDRFASMASNHLFALDNADLDTETKEKNRKNKKRGHEDSAPVEMKKARAEEKGQKNKLDTLVRSVKAKTKALHSKFHKSFL